jgi:hypothetical protein
LEQSFVPVLDRNGTVAGEVLSFAPLFVPDDNGAKLYSPLRANSSRPLQTKVRDVPRRKDFR